MADTPPPHSDSGFYAGYFRRDVPLELRSPALHWLEEYTHRHEVYITAAASPHKPSGSDKMEDATLHFLPSEPSSSGATSTSVTMPGDFKPDMLKMVQGFEDCGVHMVSKESVVDPIGGSDLFRERVRYEVPSRQREAVRPSDSVFEDVSSACSAKLNRDSVEVDDGNALAVQLYKIHVFAKSTDMLLNDPQQTALLFNWAKPQSVYDHKSGSWESELLASIDDGIWNAGKELMVLVRGVSDQQMKDLQDRWRDGARVMRF